ncbi:MAG: ammonium transporter [Pseudonocardiaceae bacterium]|nr:ammonium transporter [Pseudonocardiaceae bacterium]
MQNQVESLTVLFTEFYYWVTVVFMFLIHVGFATYEIAVVRPKNMQRTLMKTFVVIPLVTVTFFFFGWWIYNAFSNGPGITGGIAEGAGETAAPWSELMAPNLEDRINGVFWAAFLLFSWTAAAIVSGALLERVRTAAFLIIGTMVGSVLWIIDAAWGWHPEGWMVQVMGYHDAYASGVIHAIAGGATLAALIVLGPRIGKFGPKGEVRDIKPHNVWLACVGLFLIFTGFWGFYVACNIPMLDIGPNGESYFSATNIYLMPTTLSGITFNFLMSFSGGILAAYLVSRGNPFWTFSGGLAGVIATSAGNDLYHPIQSMILAAIAVVIIYKLHFYVERKFKLDDVVGAVAVHGYAGVFGVVTAGFMLWGYPAAEPVDGVSAWFTTPDGWPAINPLGNFLGAIIMFGLGFVPIFLIAKLLNRFGLLRVPRAVELVGLDVHDHASAYPYFQGRTDGDGIADEERALAQSMEGTARAPVVPGTPGAVAREDRR